MLSLVVLAAASAALFAIVAQEDIPAKTSRYIHVACVTLASAAIIRTMTSAQEAAVPVFRTAAAAALPAPRPPAFAPR